MGRKGSWIAAIKKVFSSKEKPSNEFLEKNKQKGKTEPRRRIIPIFRQPSSIEKILGDVEREHHKVQNRPQSLPLEKQSQKTNVHLRTTSSRHGSLRIGSPRAAASPGATSHRVASPNTSSNRNIDPKASFQKTVVHNKPSNSYRPEPTLAHRQVFATKIQAVYRGYMARRSFKALRGLVRLQGVVRGQNIQRQTTNAMRQLQLMVRVQTQIQSRRIQLLENQALRHHNHYKTESDSFSKWRVASESGNADWEDSVLTKEEIEARMQRKMEAAVKRERAMAYAYSHSQPKGTPKSPIDTFADHRSGSFPWWWNWLERRLPSIQIQESPARRTPNHPTPVKTALPGRRSTTPSPQPQSRNYKKHTNLNTTHSCLSSHHSSSKMSHTSAPLTLTLLCLILTTTAAQSPAASPIPTTPTASPPTVTKSPSPITTPTSSPPLASPPTITATPPPAAVTPVASPPTAVTPTASPPTVPVTSPPVVEVPTPSTTSETPAPTISPSSSPPAPPAEAPPADVPAPTTLNDNSGAGKVTLCMGLAAAVLVGFFI